MSEGKRTIFGSHGEFDIDKDGLPVGDVPTEYKVVKKVDLKEFEEWCSKFNQSRNDCDADILTIGYWYDEDGVEKYSPAEEDYRKICESGRPILMGPDTAKNLGLEK